MSRTFNPDRAFLIPQELRNIPQWIVWREGKNPTIPGTNQNLTGYTTGNGWMEFPDAVSAYENHQNLAGIGFVLTADCGLIGVDMDKCIDPETGELAEWAKQHVSEFDTYAEVSPSGAGLRLFVRGTLPGDHPKKAGHRELYTQGRYLTITGNVLTQPPESLPERPEAVARYIAAMKGKDSPTANTSGGGKDNAALAQAIISGNELHDSTRDLAFRLIDDGMKPAKVVDIVRGLMDAMPNKGDMERWQARYDDIPRLVNGAAAKTKQPASVPLSLDQFALNGMAEAMESQMLNDVHVLGELALLGQATAIYARPNTGKTLLIVRLITDAVKSGRVKAEDVFYINADDTHKGLTIKLRIAEQHGFRMLCPGYNGFTGEMLPAVLNQMIDTGTARGKVIILDTLKKFAELMDKKRISEFTELMRQFVSHGGTAVMLAHVNKHKGEDGKLVYAGTSDVPDDVDCAYTLDVIEEDKTTGRKVVKFENFKNRGDVAQEAVYEYTAARGASYQELLESVRELSEPETDETKRRRMLADKYDQNREAVQAILEALREGITHKTELVHAAMDRSGLSRRKITRALAEHEGASIADYQYWTVNREDKNAHVYRLNLGA